MSARLAAWQVLSKDLLIESAWRDVAVTTGSLDQAIHLLRKTLPLPSGEPVIETQARRGYRFIAGVSRVQRRESDTALDTVLETHRAWIEGTSRSRNARTHRLRPRPDGV